MIYLLEGPDGTGKTTLARNLVNKSISEKHTCLFFHCTNTSAKKTAEVGYSEFLEDLKNWRALDYDVVIDRAWVSNIVYTTVYEPEKEHVSEELAEKLFAAVDKAIICLPKNKSKYLMNFEKLAKSRDEAYTSDMDKIYDMFNAFAEKYCRYDMFEHITDHPELLDAGVVND